MLRRNLNRAIGDLGHGRLEDASGNYLDIGGSTDGGSRRAIDGWMPPDWRVFLDEDEVSRISGPRGAPQPASSAKCSEQP